MSASSPSSVLAAQALARVKEVVLERLRPTGARVFLFGSRATGSAHRVSDIDVAVLPGALLPEGLLAEIREALEDSDVPFDVDLVDLSAAGPAFRRRVLAEGVPWTD